MPIQTPLSDLTAMALEIEKVITKHLKLRERPGIALAFTCELTGYSEVHYIVNIESTQAVQIFRETADKLIVKSN